MNAKTFEELCELGVRYCSDEIKSSNLYHALPDGTGNLYELVDEKAWIKPIIIEFNKLGYFTDFSQPGDDGSFELKHSPHCQETGRPPRTFGIKQRAAVGGWVTPDKYTQLLSAFKEAGTGLPRIRTYTGDDGDYCTITYEVIDNIQVEVTQAEFMCGCNDLCGVWPSGHVARLLAVPCTYICTHNRNTIGAENVKLEYIGFMDTVWNDDTILWSSLLMTLRGLSTQRAPSIM
jgi:hypothetical protein